MESLLHELLDARDYLLADGATGTNYFELGLGAGDSPELWNADHADRVKALHRAFIEAGSDIVLTNTFGGNRYRLKLHDAENRVFELNELAAKNARAEADRAGKPVVVAGSMGPTGEIFAPVGSLDMVDGEAAFREQAEGLAAGGADLLWIETMSSREEVEAATRGARSTGLPVVCTLSFDTNGATMMGITPGDLVAIANELHDALCGCGTNCGVGAAEVAACIGAMVGKTSPGQLLVAKANCGVPRWEEDRIVYTGTPELMADYACIVRDSGAQIIGGCCGTTPHHVATMSQALEKTPPQPPPGIDEIERRLGEVSAGFKRQLTGTEDVRQSRRRSGRRRRA